MLLFSLLIVSTLNFNKGGDRFEAKSAAQEHFGPLLGYCDHQMMKLMVRKLRQYDVSPMQCRTLTFLYEQQEDVTQKRLQEFLW